MKKYVLSLLFLLAFTFSAKAQAPWDLIYHAVPVSPSFDLPEEISQISGQVQTAISQGKKIIMTFKTDASSLQSAIMSTFNKIKSGAILDLFGNPGQSKSGFCGQNIDKVKTKKVAQKVKEILLVRESDDFAYITEHQKQRERFYMDNILSIYAASLILQQEVENDIKAKIDKAKSCAEGKGGECGIPATDEGGNNEAIFTYGKTLEAMDSVVRLWESVASLKARLAAVKTIYSITPILDPKVAKKKKNNQAFLNIPQAIAKSHSSTPLAFAQKTTASSMVAKAAAAKAVADVKAKASLAGAEKKAAAVKAVEAVKAKAVEAKANDMIAKATAAKAVADVKAKATLAGTEKKAAAVKAVEAVKAKAVEAKANDIVAKAAAAKAVADVKAKASLAGAEKKAAAVKAVEAVKAKAVEAKAKDMVAKATVAKAVADVKAKATLAGAEKKAAAVKAVDAVKAKAVEAKANDMVAKAAAAKADAKMDNTKNADIKTKLNVVSAVKALDVKSAVQNLNKTSIDKVEAAAMVEKEADAMQYVVSNLEFVSPDMDEKENALAAVQEEMAANNEMTEVEGLVSNAIEVHNFIKELPIHRDNAKQYIEMQQRYKDAFDRLVKSEECAIRYLNGFYTKPHLVWSGNLPLKNANKHDLRKGISGWAFNAFEILKSGEATDVFTAFDEAKERETSETAKEESTAYLNDENALNEKINNTMNTSNTKPDEIAQDSLSDEEVNEMGDDTCELLDADVNDPDYKDCKDRAAEKGNKNKKKRFSQESGDKATNEAISDDKKKNAGSEARKSSMFAWQIGAEASKLLAEEDWGSPSRNRKMIWTDTKRFYKKYLEMKYNNVLRHMSSFSEADLYEIIASKMIGSSQKATEGEYQVNRKKGLLSLANEARSALKSRLEAKQKNKEAYLAKMRDIENEKKAIEAEINALNEELRATKDEVNKIKSAEAEKVMKAMQEKLTAPLKFPKKGESIPNTKIATIDSASLAVEANAKTQDSVAENKDIKQKEKRTKEIQTKIASLVAKQMKKTLDIQKTKTAGQANSISPEELVSSVSAEADLMAKLNGDGENEGILSVLQNTAAVSALGKIRTVLINSNNENPIEGFDIDVALDGIKKGARAAILEAQAKAMQIIITEGLSKMYALGDELFMGTSYSKVQQIHDNMIDKLKAVKLTFNIGTRLISPLLSIKDIAVFAEFLEGVDTTPETEGFFVGSTPKERDLKAPYSLGNKYFDLPPVREVFHFDAVDFGNLKAPVEEEASSDGGDWLENLFEKLKGAIEKAKKAKTIDKEDFLNFGGDIPEIWKEMLKEYPFIESRLPLKEVLQAKKIEKVAGVEKEVEDDSCEVASFVRGGVMPCLYGDGKYYMDVNLKGNYVNDEAKAEHKNLPPCSSIKLNGRKPYHTFWKVNLSESLLGKNDLPASNCEYSELGMLFEADEHNNLFIKDIPFKNFNRVNRRDGDPIDKMLPATKKNLAAARHSELSRNQIGDFLKQAESEKNAQETLEESKKAFEDSRDAVYALFKEYGFVPSESFNLNNKSDYSKAEKILKAIKKQRIQKAVDAMAKIKISEDNAPAKEKNKNMNKLINFMNTDVDCILKISMADADSKDLAIRLAKEIINEKILGLFKKKNEEKKENAGDIEEAYCAIY